MYPSMEIRWFYPGALPKVLVTWLAEKVNGPVAQPMRQDHYLRLPGNGALGIKLREGGMEIKRREGASQAVTFGPRVAGLAERWRKWRFDLAGGQEAAGFLIPPGAWVTVEKRRYLQRYRLEDGNGLESIDLGQGAEQGCEFEVSSLQAGSRTWWSVCFEAFGRESSLETNLMASAGHVLGDDWPLPLGLDRSYGYPTWLEEVA
jgi:hypothetical protein